MPYNLLHRQTQFPLPTILVYKIWPKRHLNISDNTNNNITTFQKQQIIISETEYNYLLK